MEMNGDGWIEGSMDGWVYSWRVGHTPDPALRLLCPCELCPFSASPTQHLNMHAHIRTHTHTYHSASTATHSLVRSCARSVRLASVLCACACPVHRERQGRTWWPASPRREVQVVVVVEVEPLKERNEAWPSCWAS